MVPGSSPCSETDSVLVRMSLRQAKRFYSETGIGPAEGGFTVVLDGKPVRTPAATVLVLPTQPLAQAISDEWAAQDEEIIPASMPVMQLSVTAVERVAPARAEVVERIAQYGASDLLCYRAEGPEDLVKRQDADWQPLLDWAAETLGAKLNVTAGIIPVEQDEGALAALRNAVGGHDDMELTALAEISQICGSLVIGLAVTTGRLGWEAAFEASRLDDSWQAERWGKDGEQTDNLTRLRNDLEAAVRFLTLSRV